MVVKRRRVSSLHEIEGATLHRDCRFHEGMTTAQRSLQLFSDCFRQMHQLTRRTLRWNKNKTLSTQSPWTRPHKLLSGVPRRGLGNVACAGRSTSGHLRHGHAVMSHQRWHTPTTHTAGITLHVCRESNMCTTAHLLRRSERTLRVTTLSRLSPSDVRVETRRTTHPSADESFRKTSSGWSRHPIMICEILRYSSWAGSNDHSTATPD